MLGFWFGADVALLFLEVVWMVLRLGCFVAGVSFVSSPDVFGNKKVLMNLALC